MSQAVISIGPYRLDSRTVLAPMAGVTDSPFRRLCRAQGAGLAVSEMVTSDIRLWNTRKSRQRLLHDTDDQPRSVQIAGSDPQMMAEAARMNQQLGAQIIDINMGCPAKKVCNKAAGSALLRDEVLVAQILEAVVSAVDIPVTLKIRTGWSRDQRNGIRIARIAEQSGIQALAVHGRTRADLYRGQAEYDTIAEIRQAIRIPLFANGDIDSPEKARAVLEHTGADAVMIGRGAQGRPWLFAQINHYLEHGRLLADPSMEQRRQIMLDHLLALHDFHGEHMGVRIARKHIGWYLQYLPDCTDFRSRFNRLETPQAQHESIVALFNRIMEGGLAA
ncbi:MAG: tRNA dihydrouridine synthase DusB [Halopseudomonas yangmingensis]|uniref:tRNA-dihydrouridine synthase B n=1 Tax=Halopseudomonas yangmingensis TaxID=1720063 RepID=A0A1I4NBG3_9GAMM|nr:tRNA dihydrouridine synthase DusB [Halopseudomonas yangmingensis]SFM12630.1 tRNA-dihydrouridine synthase B [Halopseudomonas yangmingensis]